MRVLMLRESIKYFEQQPTQGSRGQHVCHHSGGTLPPGSGALVITSMTTGGHPVSSTQVTRAQTTSASGLKEVPAYPKKQDQLINLVFLDKIDISMVNCNVNCGSPEGSVIKLPSFMELNHVLQNLSKSWTRRTIGSQ